MIDVVREATIVPLPLQFAMIAHRAGGAVKIIKLGTPLCERQSAALKNAFEFVKQALEGEEMLSGKKGVYDPHAMSAFEAAMGVRTGEQSPREFLQDLKEKVEGLLRRPTTDSSTLDGLRAFFSELSKWCLAQNKTELERVRIDVTDS